MSNYDNGNHSLNPLPVCHQGGGVTKGTQRRNKFVVLKTIAELEEHILEKREKMNSARE
jgi:hypothetical protein